MGAVHNNGDDFLDRAVMSKGSTQTIDFEGVPSGPVPNGYGGLNWDNVIAMPPQGDVPVSGYANVLNSGTQIAFDGANPSGPDGLPASFSSNESFDLRSGYFAAAWNNDEHISFIAYDHGTQVGDAELEINPTKTFIDFKHETAVGAVSAQFTGRFTNIDEVNISAFGGTNAGLPGSGVFFAMDDLQVSFKPAKGPERDHTGDVFSSAPRLRGCDSSPLEDTRHLFGPARSDDAG